MKTKNIRLRDRDLLPKIKEKDKEKALVSIKWREEQNSKSLFIKKLQYFEKKFGLERNKEMYFLLKKIVSRLQLQEITHTRTLQFIGVRLARDVLNQRVKILIKEKRAFMRKVHTTKSV